MLPPGIDDAAGLEGQAGVGNGQPRFRQGLLHTGDRAGEEGSVDGIWAAYIAVGDGLEAVELDVAGRDRETDGNMAVLGR